MHILTGILGMFVALCVLVGGLTIFVAVMFAALIVDDIRRIQKEITHARK